MPVTVRRVHPGPGVIADAQVGDQDCQPRQVLDAVDTAAGAVTADGSLHLPATGPYGSQLRNTISCGLAEIYELRQAQLCRHRRAADAIG